MGDRLDVGRDRVDPLELSVDVHDRRRDLAEQRNRLVGDAGHELACLAHDLAELDEDEGDEADQHRPEDGDDEPGDLASGQTARESRHRLRCSSVSVSVAGACPAPPRTTSRSAASRWEIARSAPCSEGR